MSFSKEDIEKAREISILDVAKKIGFTLINQGKVYTTKEHDSLKLYPRTNTFYRFSTGEGGDVINFLQIFENFKFKEAIDFLIGENNSAFFEKQEEKIKVQEEKRKDLVIPTLNKTFFRALNFLTTTRKISKEVVDECFKNELIKEDIHHNIMFLGYDENKKIKYISLSGTNPQKKFKKEVSGSDKSFAFRYENKKSDKVFIFEAPIDLLSLKTILKIKGCDNQYSFLSLGGTCFNSLDNFLQQNKNIKILYFSLDNDEAGKKAFDKAQEKYKDKYLLKNISNFYAGFKDINDFLVATTNRSEQIKKQENKNQQIFSDFSKGKESIDTVKLETKIILKTNELSKLKLSYEKIKKKIIEFLKKEYNFKISNEKDLEKIDKLINSVLSFNLYKEKEAKEQEKI